jgi:hypothetical protein
MLLSVNDIRRRARASLRPLDATVEGWTLQSLEIPSGARLGHVSVSVDFLLRLTMEGSASHS